MVFAAAMLRVIDSDKNASNSDKTSSNAITLTELFRRYPPLSTFIPSVLRACLEEMESQGNVKSEMFPILLMLSRVQPVMDSSTTISEEFVPLLFRCLGSKDHGIRHAAARSLANLTSKAIASAVLSDCKRHIQEVSSNDARDWNLVDGMLLAMESLDLSTHAELLDAEAQRTLIGLVNSDLLPPSCRSTALGILSSSTFADNDSVRRACDKITKNGSIRSMIGGTLLYKTASEVLCQMSQESIWQATSESILENGLSQLKGVLVNEIIDVRLYAAKCFKKRIYGNLDRLRATGKASNTTSSLPPMKILNGLASVLLECVAAELSRGIAYTTGSHIPTLRRLSRCFLETVDAIPKSSLLVANYGLIWSISHQITEREHSFLAEEGSLTNGVGYLESNGGNVLSSNAVEMMAVAIAMEGDAHAAMNGDEEGGHRPLHEKTRILLKVVGSLNDPSASWRSRYSAALALETCCSLVLVADEEEQKEDENNDKDTIENTLRREILMIVLELLQDSDPDVRTVAVRAATKFYATRDKRNNDNNSSSFAHHLLLPEWTLETTFPSAFAVVARKQLANRSSTMELLQAMILDHCKGLSDAVEGIQEEFSNTDRYYQNDEEHDGASRLNSLVNVNTTRKIFEDEDPNPYQEKILLNQLAIQSLLGLKLKEEPSNGESLPLAENTLEVWTTCDSILTGLLDTQNNGGMVHEVSRFPTVFPSLHSILCASATSLYLVGKGDESDSDGLRGRLRMSAEKLISRDNESGDNDSENQSSHRSLHPLIRSALGVLSRDSERLPTKGEIQELLFLLKPTAQK